MGNIYRTYALLVLLVLLAIVPAAFAQDDAASSVPVHSFADGSELESTWSVLRRYENGLSMTLHTNNLVPGDAYTIWWVAFNDFENCTDNVCNEDDIFVLDESGAIVLDDFGQRVMSVEALENANVSIQYATGGYVNESGEGHFAASVAAGEVPGIIFGPGVLDPQNVEVHLVVRTHGPVVADQFDAQILDFGGGCDPADAPPCADVQFAIHKAA